jgi:prepilin-type N-terminal cleavage/methylation domain-containing protein
LKKNFLHKIGHHGFTLVEVMVALMLVVLIFTIIPFSGSDQDHSKLQETIQDFDRAIKFSVNEAILRNSVTRLMIDLDTNPQEYAVEFGPSGNLVLPNLDDESRMSLKERENQQKIVKTIDSQFNRVDEFSEKAKKLPDGVTVIGLASSYLKDIKKEGKVAIYFYPTGEKDNSVIFLSTPREMSWLDVPPFENETKVEYYIFSEPDLVNLDYSQDNKMKEVYDQWLKN